MEVTVHQFLRGLVMASDRIACESNNLAKMRASPFSSQAAPDDLSNSES